MDIEQIESVTQVINAINWDVILAILTFIAVATALFFGIKSLYQTKDIEKRRYKYDRLSDIRNWALDIIECNTDENLTVLERQIDKGWEHPSLHVQVGFLPSRFVALKEKGNYIKRISSEFSQRLINAVENVNGLIEKHTNMMRGIPGSWSPEGCRKNREPLSKAVEELLEELINNTPKVS